MTRSEVMKDFMKKTVVPVAVALLLFSVFSRIFVENGTPDYFLIWLACGVPFGMILRKCRSIRTAKPLRMHRNQFRSIAA